MTKKESLNVLLVCSWSFIITIITFIFGYTGLYLDKLFKADIPYFMVGFIILSVILCMIRLYNDIKSKIKNR
jgi:amino acid transporter